jgi:hypothetical protein
MDEFLFFFYHNNGESRAFISTYPASFAIVKIRNEMSRLFTDALRRTMDITGCAFLTQMCPDLRPLGTPFPCVDIIGGAPNRDSKITA